MIKSLTVAFLTAREHPNFGWFYHSLCRETGGDFSNIKIIIVDSIDRELNDWEIEHVAHWIKPKPTIWQGEHRITKENWWSKCNSANTAIALCETEWISFVDDRSVLAHGWLQAVQDSIIHGYAVCGSYEKRSGMKVENGEIIHKGELLGYDDRPQRGFPVPSKDWYGGSCALPLEWCLEVNGFPEDVTDGLGFEDVAFGILLRNNNFDTRYDSRMKIIEDRTPTELSGALKRASKPSPDPNNKLLAKDYRILDIMRGSFVSGNSYDIRELRDRTLKGEPFPMPTASHTDWFDGASIAEMT